MCVFVLILVFLKTQIYRDFPTLVTFLLIFQSQGLKGCCDTLFSLQDLYRVELVHREIPVIYTGNGFAV